MSIDEIPTEELIADRLATIKDIKHFETVSKYLGHEAQNLREAKNVLAKIETELLIS